jgi:hypothetical protein
VKEEGLTNTSAYPQVGTARKAKGKGGFGEADVGDSLNQPSSDYGAAGGRIQQRMERTLRALISKVLSGLNITIAAESEPVHRIAGGDADQDAGDGGLEFFPGALRQLGGILFRRGLQVGQVVSDVLARRSLFIIPLLVRD